MKIKKKLFLGFGILFIVVLILGAVSIYYIEVISETSNVTLKNNYETLIFTRQMRSVLDENDLPLTPAARAVFNKALVRQEHNITEPGEKEATGDLRKDFDLLVDPAVNLNQKQAIERNTRLGLNKIEGLNMRAVVIKNEQTHATVTTATLYLGGVALITFVILFVLIANFPGFIIDPLNEFRDGLLEISQKNYDYRLDLKTSEEFVQISDAFNKMAGKLGESENTDLTKLVSAELTIKSLIAEMQDAVIGINEKDEFLFINAAAKEILNLSERQVVGQSVQTLIKGHKLLKTIIEHNEADTPIKINLDNKEAYFQLIKREIILPNLKPDLNTLQVTGYPGGMIYLLKNVTELNAVAS